MDKTENLEANAILVLKKEIYCLETQTLDLRRKLKSTKDRIDKINSNLILARQQKEIFNQETNRALEGIKDTNWQFTKEACYEITKIKKPNSTLLNVADKFMLILDQKDRSWNTFKAVVKNYPPVKSLMSSLQAQYLTEEQMTELLTVWKNQQLILHKLRKYCKGVSIITEWINYSVEYKLKKETLASIEQKFNELQTKQTQLVYKISEINSLILTKEERISEIKMTLESTELLKVDEDITDLSTYTNKSNTKTEERAVITTPLHQGTASGGIMKLSMPSTPKFPKQFFPDFELNSDELYLEAPVKKVLEEENKPICYDDVAENIGCCRLKYFCF